MVADFTHGKHGWIAVVVSEEWEQWAKTLRTDRDRQYRNIYEVAPTDERWVGDLGEKVFDAWLKDSGSQNHKWILAAAAGKADFISPAGLRIGVKTVKRKVPPQLDYTAQVTARHVKEPVEEYFFLSYQFEARRMWLLGGIDKATFLRVATYYGPGARVHANYTIRPGHEIYNAPIAALTMPAAWYALHFRK